MERSFFSFSVTSYTFILAFSPVAKQRRNCGKIVALLFTEAKMGYNNFG